MLKFRIYTTMIGLPLLLAMIYFLNEVSWGVVITFVVGICAWEWARLFNFSNRLRQMFIATLVISCLFLLVITYNSSIVLVNELIFFLVFACLSLAIAVTPCSIIFRWQIRQGLTAILIGWFLLFGLWYSAFYLQQDSNFLILILGVIFLGDTAAYLFGKKFGKNKMLPSVSPGKTWEGFLGSIVVALMFCLLLSVSLSHSLSVVDIAFLGCISIILIILGVMGDLFISLVKRQNGKKDTGIILPGHGGILDRVDSMIFSLPFSFLLVSGISW